jgi:hypothetical protein
MRMCRGVNKMYDKLSAMSFIDEDVSWFHFILLYFAIGGGAGVMDKVSMGYQSLLSHSLKQEEGMKAMDDFISRYKVCISFHSKPKPTALPNH